METYGLLGLAYYAAFFIPSFDGEAFRRPIRKSFFIESDMSLSMTVSEPTDFESIMILLTCGAFFCIRKLNTSFSSSVLGSAAAVFYCVFTRVPGGWQSFARYWDKDGDCMNILKLFPVAFLV